jgi:hypothetical protein
MGVFHEVEIWDSTLRRGREAILDVLKHAVESAIAKAVGNWKLKVDLEDTLLVECMNKMMVTSKDSDCHGMHCSFEGNFEEIKGKNHCGHLEERSKGRSTEWNHEKGQAQDGKVDGNDCLIRE